MGKVVLPKEDGAFKFGYEWLCQAEGCNAAPSGAEPRPARLFIRSKVDKIDAASNFDHKRTVSDPLGRWTKQQPSELNWQGMAEERGWKTSPHVVCPACQVGMNVLDYRHRTGTPQVIQMKIKEISPEEIPVAEESPSFWQKLRGK